MKVEKSTYDDGISYHGIYDEVLRKLDRDLDSPREVTKYD